MPPSLAPRIPPGDLSTLGVINWAICRALSRVVGARDAHLFSTLAHQPRLFRAWLAFAGRMMPGGMIDRRETELVILRVASLRECAYERDHHTRIARKLGMDDALVERALAGPEAEGWSDRHRALLGAVDTLVALKDLDEPSWAALRRHYKDGQIVELCLLVGHYEMLATTIRALRIERDF